MGLNKTKGNMYDWITHTWNTVKGGCPHGCEYCYMKRWGNQPALHFDEKELKTDLGKNNTIFVGSSCDLFAEDVKFEWVFETIEHCIKFIHNRYLFQTKNPKVLWSHAFQLPKNSIIGTTIETNRIYPQMGNTPSPISRMEHIIRFGGMFPKMVTIEPIIDFDLGILQGMVRDINPEWVNIGANTNSKIRLPEPPAGKIIELISELENFTEVKIKSNLKRLTCEGKDEILS